LLEADHPFAVDDKSFRHAIDAKVDAHAPVSVGKGSGIGIAEIG
jgi:hypothetical protein